MNEFYSSKLIGFQTRLKNNNFLWTKFRNNWRFNQLFINRFSGNPRLNEIFFREILLYLISKNCITKKRMYLHVCVCAHTCFVIRDPKCSWKAKLTCDLKSRSIFQRNYQMLIVSPFLKIIIAWYINNRFPNLLLCHTGNVFL